ncbi:hypothetical protein Tco_1170474 [Tanacetum coccineum]
MALEERTAELDEGYTGSNPGPNPEPMHEDFIATIYPKNLDAFTFGDQFIDDKSPKDELGKPNVETKVESMAFGEASRPSSLAFQSFNPGQSFLQSFELQLWPFDQIVHSRIAKLSFLDVTACASFVSEFSANPTYNCAFSITDVA